jgi:ubiquinone/menaquinone biosynthesis C-methylase UbiE
MSETAKHREQARPFCEGNGLDIGSSGFPIVPWAIQLDLPMLSYVEYRPDRPDTPIHWRGDCRDLPFKSAVLDWLHSSHVIEDFEDWLPVLREWDRVLKIGGFMLIAVPDHDRFRAAVAAGQGDNLGHRHESRIGELSEYLAPTYHVFHDGFVSDDPKEYSILFIGRKHSLMT